MQRTAGCAACGKRIEVPAAAVLTHADSAEAARAALLDATGSAPRERPREGPLRDAIERARSARGERNRLKALVDALLQRPAGFTLDELTQAAAVLGIPEATAHAYVERREDAYRPRPGEYRGVR